MALTAALCRLHSASTSIFFSENSVILLSFPPVAIISQAGLSFSPHIYCSCALYRKTQLSCRGSHRLTQPSLPPEQMRLFPHPTEPTLPRCAPVYLSNLCLGRSSRVSYPLLSPMVTLLLPGRNCREQMNSPSSFSQNALVTLVAQPDQTNSPPCRPTPMLPLSAQSTKLRQKSSLRQVAGNILQGCEGRCCLLVVLGASVTSGKFGFLFSLGAQL